jgi:hypothetical protein
MKKLLSSIIVFACVLASPVLKLHAQSTFEGTITWNMSIPQMGDDDKHPMVINVKGQKLESELDMGAMGAYKTYIDLMQKKGYLVMGAMKNGYIIDMPTDSNVIKNSGNLTDAKPTGKTETIAGHSATEYLLKGIKAKGMTVDMSIWVASDFPKDVQNALTNGLMHGSGGEDSKESNAMRQFAAQGLVPVRVTASTGGEVAMTMDFVKYEQKSLDDSLFVPPTDVKFGPMPKMGGGMN